MKDDTGFIFKHLVKKKQAKLVKLLDYLYAAKLIFTAALLLFNVKMAFFITLLLCRYKESLVALI